MLLIGWAKYPYPVWFSPCVPEPLAASFSDRKQCKSQVARQESTVI